MNELVKKRKKHIVVPKICVAGIILILLLIFIFYKNKNWFPMIDRVELKPGIYLLEGTDSQILVSENNTFRLVDFDLNGSMKEKYHGYDLNAEYLGREVGYNLQAQRGSVYSILTDVDMKAFLEFLYYPRDNEICVYYPDIDLKYTFKYSGQ